MQELTLQAAQEIVEAALTGPRSTPRRPIAVAVCDAGGHPLALGREEDAPPLLAHIAQMKAFTCMAYGKPTKTIEATAADYPVWFHGISRVAQQTMGGPLIGSKGGVIVKSETGRVRGAVGVAGEAGEIDEALAVVGIAAAGLAAEPGLVGD